MGFYHFGANKLRKVKCKVCGKTFTTHHPSKCTCSDECSMINKNNYKEVIVENNKRYYSKARKSK